LPQSVAIQVFDEFKNKEAALRELIVRDRKFYEARKQEEVQSLVEQYRSGVRDYNEKIG